MAAFGGLANLIGKATGGSSIAGGVAFALNAGFTAYGAQEAISRGENPIPAWGKAIATTMLYNEFFFPLTALQLAPLFPILHQQVQNYEGRMQSRLTPMGPGRFQDTQYAQTSRMRALQAIQMSRLNARQYVGSEAGLFASRYR
jgi:hypothetical protein